VCGQLQAPVDILLGSCISPVNPGINVEIVGPATEYVKHFDVASMSAHFGGRKWEGQARHLPLSLNIFKQMKIKKKSVRRECTHFLIHG
jgi:hypothetical protein